MMRTTNEVEYDSHYFKAACVLPEYAIIADTAAPNLPAGVGLTEKCIINMYKHLHTAWICSTTKQQLQLILKY
jgi:hypothetical protein